MKSWSFFGEVGWTSGLGDCWKTCSFLKISAIRLQGCSEVLCLNSLIVKLRTGVSGLGLTSIPSFPGLSECSCCTNYDLFSDNKWSLSKSCISSWVSFCSFSSSCSISYSIWSNISFTSYSCYFISSKTSIGTVTFCSTKAGFISRISGGITPKLLYLSLTSCFSFFLGILDFKV